MALTAPILLIVFNRPDTTEQLLANIRQVQPSKLYVAADGARLDKAGEQQLCEQTKELIKQINWPCSIKTLFREKNLGCKQAVSSAITWFFEHETEGIILEDDCIPHPTFFKYCQTLLEYYRHDENIMMISGDNFQQGVVRGDGSYYFSKNAHVWGWATWQRAWRKYDITMSSYPKFKSENQISNIYPDLSVQQYWLRNFDAVYNNLIDTWDFQWVYAILTNNGLSINPNTNLVTNIGFRSDATHTKTNNGLAQLPTAALETIVHPAFKISNVEADQMLHKKKNILSTWWSAIK